ncbi:MAG TPA: hypothetical protein VH350_09130, partial [Candidatus Sulfotelmatobacter sp.]|nr:hypothetical protein [Candidatus Sulfotelmatobacter sp.]
HRHHTEFAKLFLRRTSFVATIRLQIDFFETKRYGEQTGESAHGKSAKCVSPKLERFCLFSMIYEVAILAACLGLDFILFSFAKASPNFAEPIPEIS